MKSVDKLNYKLSEFFKSKKFYKKASLGNFSDIKDKEEMAKSAVMTKEMLDLPKYQSIISDLKGSTGIVNFVTNDEYQPLVELLIKTAFPSTTNDIYNMGQSEASGEEYFISPSFFAKDAVAGSSQQAQAARTKLQDLLLGTKAHMTREWLKKEKHFTDDQIQHLLGSPNQQGAIDQIMQQQAQNPGAPLSDANPLGVLVSMYEMRMSAIKSKYDPNIQQINKELLEHSTGERELKVSDINEKKEQREIWISLKRSEINNINNTIGKAITVEKWYPGQSYRNSDGFISSTTQEEAVAASVELAMKIQANKPEADILRASLDLKMKLEDYQTNNSNLQQVKEQFIKFLGNGTHDDYLRIRANIRGLYMQLQYAFVSMVKRQGKVLILDDFDKSVLCNPAHPEGNETRLDDLTRGAFLDFAGKNASNLERDDSQGKRERGNRIIVILSSDKIVNLPASSVVEMDVAPVDIAEAEIIVRNILKQYATDASRNLKRRLHREIDEKHGTKTTGKKGFDKELINEQIESMEDSLASISDDTKKKMMGMIIGMGQRSAIDAVRTAVRSGLKVDDSNVLDVEISFDEKTIISNLRNTVNTKLSTDVYGLTVLEPEVEFDNYAYKRTSEWANKVRGMKDVRDELVDLKECIKDNEQRIRSIDKDIAISNKMPAGDKRKLDKEDVTLLMQERKGLIDQTAHYKTDRHSIAANDIPHVYVLYGPPGVGKSIWAHALASLLKINIKTVDIGAQKDKWLGNTEKNAIRLFNSMKNSRDTIYLIDEIDRQVEMGGAQSVGTHETTKEIVSRFLEFFDNTENERLFRKNNVFFIMTSNNVQDIDTALLQRVSEAYHVELPDEPEDYQKFFKSYMDVEKNRFPDDPWFCALEDKNTEECWTTTFNMVNALDWEEISKVFAEKQIDFRSLKKMLQQAFNAHRSWRIRMKLIGKGREVEPLGLPLTTENLLAVGHIIETGAESNDAFKLGVGALAKDREEQVRKIMEPYVRGEKQLETQSVTDPHTGQVQETYVLPKEVLDVMEGKVAAQMPGTEAEEWEYSSEETPEGQKRVDLRRKGPKPEDQMQELTEDSFEEQPLEETDQEKIKSEKEKPSPLEKKEEEVKSSTDYLFNFLKKEGFVTEDGDFVSPKKENKTLKIKKTENKKVKEAQVLQASPEQQMASDGVYMFGRESKPFIMIAPGSATAPPQIIQSESKRV